MHTLKLTDGVTTIDFGNPSGNYPVRDGGYQPKVNGLRLQSLGGRGIYDEVEETITIDIVDPASAAACYARMNTLTKLLLQAQRFSRGEAVTPVVLQYSPDQAAISSSGSPLQALVIGLGEKVPSGIENSPEYDKASFLWVIREVTITIRRGVWLQGVEAQTASAAQGQIASFTFATNVDYFSPTDVYIDGILNGITYQPPFVVIGSGATSIQIVRAANTTGSPSGTGWTYVNDSGSNNPRNTNVLRYTPPDTLEHQVNSCYDTCSLTEGKRYAVIVACRNNSPSTSFAVRASIQYPTPHFAPTDYTEFRTVKPYSGSAAPGYISLGTFVAPITDAAVLMQLNVTASAASGSIDFDGVIVVEADNAAIIQAQNRTKISSGSNRNEHFWIENRFLDGLTMRVRGQTIFTPKDFIESRNGGDVLTYGTAVRAIVLAPEGVYWGMGGTVPPSTESITLTRTRVHLSPE